MTRTPILTTGSGTPYLGSPLGPRTEDALRHAAERLFGGPLNNSQKRNSRLEELEELYDQPKNTAPELLGFYWLTGLQFKDESTILPLSVEDLEAIAALPATDVTITHFGEALLDNPDRYMQLLLGAAVYARDPAGSNRVLAKDTCWSAYDEISRPIQNVHFWPAAQHSLTERILSWSEVLWYIVYGVSVNGKPLGYPIPTRLFTKPDPIQEECLVDNYSFEQAYNWLWQHLAMLMNRHQLLESAPEVTAALTFVSNQSQTALTCRCITDPRILVQEVMDYGVPGLVEFWVESGSTSRKEHRTANHGIYVFEFSTNGDPLFYMICDRYMEILTSGIQ